MLLKAAKPMTAKPLIRIDELTVRYGPLVAVNRVSLEIREGEIFGLVGPNGAGKTTTLKVLAGLLLPDGGRVTVDDLDVVSDRIAVRARIGYMADFFGVYDYLTTYEYLAFFGGIYGLSGPRLEERINRVLDIVNLAGKRDAFVRALSRGMKQRLYFGRALIHEPRLLILDEPASGMDPRGRAELVETLRQANRQGQTIIISSHILDELQDLCTMVGIMEAGRLIGANPLRRPPADTAHRAVLLLLAAGEAERALSLLQGREDVFSARVGAGGIVLETRNDDDTVAGLVRYLAAHEVRMLLPRADTADLKDIFMRLTKGELT